MPKNIYLPKENFPKIEEVREINNEIPTYEEFINKKSQLSPSARSKIIKKYGGNYQSPLIDTDISEIKGYGPCYVCYKDTRWVDLYIGCPTDYCSDRATSYWYHSNSGYLNASGQSGCGRLEVSNNGMIKCRSCRTSSPIKNWSFSCSYHRGDYRSVSNSSFARSLMSESNEVTTDLFTYLRSH